MKRAIIKRTKALWDIIDIAEHLGKDDPAIAEKFMDAVDESLAFLQDFPESGIRLASIRRKIRFVRLWPVKGFPNHLIVFDPSAAELEVLRVIHGARNLDKLL